MAKGQAGCSIYLIFESHGPQNTRIDDAELRRVIGFEVKSAGPFMVAPLAVKRCE